jgi:hypothetical protein
MQFHPQVENLIADLRGLPRGYRNLRSHPLVELGSVVEVLEEKYQLGNAGIEPTLIKHWRYLVGERAAHRCAPQRLMDSGSRLVVYAANSMVRQELMFEQTGILKRIHSLEGCHVVRSLTIRMG